MGTHICNNCEHSRNCGRAFENNLMCLNINKEIKQKQEKRFDNSELKDFVKFMEDNK